MMNETRHETVSAKLESSPTPLASGVALLGHKDGMVRQEARHWLVRRGRDAVPLLLEALSDSRTRVRWEAAKALYSIADPGTAAALVKALEDEDSGVRWIAAEALAALQHTGLEALVNALIERPESARLYEGAHRVCHALLGGALGTLVKPLLEALDPTAPSEGVPPAAYEVLRHFENRD
jgi:HEAT repeat protein